MMNRWSIYGVLFLTFSTIKIATFEIKYNKKNNVLEMSHVIDVVPNLSEKRALTDSSFTPPPPYNNTTFTVVAPEQVALGQEFTLYFAVQVQRSSNIPFWADIIPDPSQSDDTGIEVVDYSEPTIGFFDIETASMFQKGGKGIWYFQNELASNTTQKFQITLRATQEGAKQYTSYIAINPPAPFSIGFSVLNGSLRALPDLAIGKEGIPLKVAVLCNDICDTPVAIVEVSGARRGTVIINEDKTITYSPNYSFVGEDTFTYTIEDAFGNRASAPVTVRFIENPKPKIVR